MTYFGGVMRVRLCGGSANFLVSKTSKHPENQDVLSENLHHAGRSQRLGQPLGAGLQRHPAQRNQLLPTTSSTRRHLDQTATQTRRRDAKRTKRSHHHTTTGHQSWHRPSSRSQHHPHHHPHRPNPTTHHDLTPKSVHNHLTQSGS